MAAVPAARLDPAAGFVSALCQPGGGGGRLPNLSWHASIASEELLDTASSDKLSIYNTLCLSQLWVPYLSSLKA